MMSADFKVNQRTYHELTPAENVSNTIYLYEPNRPLACKKTLNYCKEHVKLQGGSFDSEVNKQSLNTRTR